MKNMINKKIASEVAIGIIVLIALVLGGIFYLQNKKIVEQVTILPVSKQNKTTENIQQNTQEKNVTKENQSSLTTYQKVEINNPQLKFSFEIPDFWTAEKRISGEKEMTLDEKKDFLADVLNGDSQYADYTRADFSKMTAKEIRGFFGNFPVVSVKNGDVISYSDTSWEQIDFKIIGKKELDDYMSGLTNSEQISANGSDKKIGKIKVEKITIDGLVATMATFPTDIDENGKEEITKSGSGGKYIFIRIGNTEKYLFIFKQSKGEEQYEKDFQHLIQTLKIENK